MNRTKAFYVLPMSENNGETKGEMKKGKRGFKLKKTALAISAGVFLFLSCLNFPFGAKITCVAQSPKPENLTKTPKQDLLLSRYTTYFDGSNLPRSHNIRLACQKLNGQKITEGGEFSFNRTVGARTKERGFLDAPVIFEGQFVSGVGGGVCQVSTTLYNAALLAGMVVTEARSHSLQVGYVPPSLDAMVSSASDMKFVNPSSAPVVIRTYTGQNSVTAEIYGKSTGYSYKTESVTLSVITPPEPEIVEGEEDRTLKQARDGLKSESYLIYYRHGKRVKSKRIRRDTYAFIRGVEQKKRENAEASPEENQNTSLKINSFGKITQND